MVGNDSEGQPWQQKGVKATGVQKDVHVMEFNGRRMAREGRQGGSTIFKGEPYKEPESSCTFGVKGE